MDPAFVPVSTPASVVFQDGLGERRRIVDPTGNETLEILCLRDELTAVPSFEFALRERVSRLANFRHATYGRVRSVDRLNDPGSTLAVVSEYTAGVRLSDLLAVAERKGLTLDINAALCLIRQLVPAIAMLHENARDVAHGAIGPERIVVTPNARVVVVEYVMGAALEQLRFSHERYWKELHIALPRSAGLPRFDHRADVLQLGMVALSLILGRQLRDDEYPTKIGEVVASAWAISARGGFEPLPPGLRSWLTRTLQLDARGSMATTSEARAELDKVLGDSDYLAAPAALETFLAQYHAVADPPTVGQAAAAPAAKASVPVPPPAPRAETPRPAAPGAPTMTFAPLTLPTPSRSASTPAGSILQAPSSGAPSAPKPSGAASPERSAAAEAPRSFIDSLYSSESPARRVESTRSGEPPLRRDKDPFAPPAKAQTPVGTPASPYGEPSHREAGKDAMHKDGLLRDSIQRDLGTPHRDQRDNAHDIAALTSLWTSQAPLPALQPKVIPELPRRSRTPMIVAAIVVLAVVGGGYFAVKRLVGAGGAASTGTLSVSSNPPGAQVIVDGQPKGFTPLTLTLKAGTHSVELQGTGDPRTIPVTITAGTQASQYIELPKSGSATGQLQVRTDPSGAQVSIDGTPRGASPLTIGDLPPGEHTVVLQNDLGSVKQTVTIQAGITAALVVPLTAPEGAPVSGWLAVSAPVDVEIFENSRLLGSSQSDRLMVSAGRHELEIKNDTLGYRVVRTVQVTPGKVTPIRIEFPKGTLAINAIPWAEVWIDGQKIGETPLGNVDVSIGPHEIIFRHPELGERRHAITVTLNTPARLSVDMRQK